MRNFLKNKANLAGLIIVAGMITACIISLIVMRQHEGFTVNVYVKDSLYKSVSLSENTTFTVDTEYGSNQVTVKDGVAYMSDADCPDKTCMSMGKIKYDNQSIVCLPHRVVVTIEGKEEYDVIL